MRHIDPERMEWEVLESSPDVIQSQRIWTLAAYRPVCLIISLCDPRNVSPGVERRAVRLSDPVWDSQKTNPYLAEGIYLSSLYLHADTASRPGNRDRKRKGTHTYVVMLRSPTHCGHYPGSRKIYSTLSRQGIQWNRGAPW